MTTFNSWFEAQAGRGDVVGEMARAWRDAKGERPRASGVQAVTGWLLADPDRTPTVPAAEQEPAMVAAANEYRTGAHQAAGMGIPGRPLAAVAPLPGDEQPADGGGDVWAAVAASLGRIEAGMLQLMQRQDAHEVRIAPLVRLLGELEQAEQAGQAADQGEHGLETLSGQLGDQQPGPAANGQAGPVSGAAFYRGAAPEPDLARIAELGDPGAVGDDEPWRSGGEVPGG